MSVVPFTNGLHYRALPESNLEGMMESALSETGDNLKYQDPIHLFADSP